VAEVCIYFPYKLEDGSFTTPFQLVHKVKPDLRVIFPMFGLAAVQRERIGEITLNKFDGQSVFMIAVGRCPNSNGLQFYNPLNGSFVSSIDDKFQPVVLTLALDISQAPLFIDLMKPIQFSCQNYRTAYL
jgi:hypothetical protein